MTLSEACAKRKAERPVQTPEQLEVIRLKHRIALTVELIEYGTEYRNQLCNALPVLKR